ncbi:MAG: C10 family peptidase [Planctomycetaceae bacterium]|nr:C10 family peptidase [Planctomycetaceae bacterium]
MKRVTTLVGIYDMLSNRLFSPSFPKIAIFALLFLFNISLFAEPTEKSQALIAADHWLKLDTHPLGNNLKWHVKNIETFSDSNQEPIYYAINLEPTGYVIVSADNKVEPIICFSAEGKYINSNENPLSVLLNLDLHNRIHTTRRLVQVQKNNSLHFSRQQKTILNSMVSAEAKWNRFLKQNQKLQNQSKTKNNELFSAESSSSYSTGLTEISDIRVEPLIQSKWGQSSVCSGYCYNYYTPNHYVCGCVATAAAQLMRYHEYPSAPVGIQGFSITVDGYSQTAYTRGGDGLGGAYNWSLMPFVPDCSLTDAQRQAIGAICYDAGVASNMQYTQSFSGAYSNNLCNALVNFFQFNNAIIGPWDMSLNADLDAGYPMYFDLGSHAVVCDGYGYSLSTPYHHINLGWSGGSDAWYNLPDVLYWDSIKKVIYNIFPSGTGEIISGRTADILGNPISDVNISVQYNDQILHTLTNHYGIYSFTHVPSNTAFTINASKNGLSFPSSLQVTTGLSQTNQVGNIWGANFYETSLPVINTNTKEIEFNAIYGTSSQDSKILSIWNEGSGTLKWTIDCNGTWLNIYPQQGISDGQINDVNLSVDISYLTPGKHTCEIIVSDPCAISTATIKITLFIARELHVPADYSTIQAAVDASFSGPGNIITIAPGIYQGAGNKNINISNKDIVIRSQDPNNAAIVAATIIDCQNQYSGNSCFSISDSNSTIDGLCIINSYEAIYSTDSQSNPVFKNCLIKNNTYGFYLYSGNIEKCTILDNVYGISMYSGQLKILDSIISYNSQAGIRNNSPSNFVLKNCIISHNKGLYGGIYNSTTKPGKISIENCTIANNVATSIQGGGIYSTGLAEPNIAVEILNSIVWDNKPKQIVVENNSVKITYSDIEGGWQGTGNINTDPCFVNPTEIILSDLDKNGRVDFYDFRIFASAWRTNSRHPSWNKLCDIFLPTDNIINTKDLFVFCQDWLYEAGEDEFPWTKFDYHLKSQAGRWKASAYSEIDSGNDNYIDFRDFAAFANLWLNKGAGIPADFDKNTVVDFDDLAFFLNNYLSSFDNGNWIIDTVTSPCIDAGDPNSDWTEELSPNGNHINMGAYGGKSQASLSQP